jgi:hypothetical protein
MDSRTPPELKLDYYGWTEEDLKKEFSIKNVLPRFVNAVPEGKMTLGQIIEELKIMYCELGERVSGADPQATTSVSNTSTLPTEDSATGSENESRFPDNGNTPPRRSE